MHCTKSLPLTFNPLSCIYGFIIIMKCTKSLTLILNPIPLIVSSIWINTSSKPLTLTILKKPLILYTIISNQFPNSWKFTAVVIAWLLISRPFWWCLANLLALCFLNIANLRSFCPALPPLCYSATSRKRGYSARSAPATPLLCPVLLFCLSRRNRPIMPAAAAA